MAVIEMGANHQKEIEGYCKYTLPTHGMITNAGKHIWKALAEKKALKKGKGELFDFLRAHDGTAFVMWDYDYLQKMSRGIAHIVTYGTHNAQVTGTVNRSEPFLEVQIGEGDAAFNIHSQLVGDYNLPNVLAAACVARYFKIADEDIQSAIAAYAPSNSRSQLMKKGSNQIILDAYNANPSSMKAAIENFAKLDGEKKMLLLGGMMELGKESEAEHREIVSLIERYAWQQVALVGGDFLRISHPFLQFNDSTEARDWLASHPPQHATILIKGSRSMKMENLTRRNFLGLIAFAVLTLQRSNMRVMSEAASKPGYLISTLDNRCPRCRRGKIFANRNPYKKGLLKMNETCPVCGQPTELEVGFYYGTAYVSYALTVAFSVATFLAWYVVFGFSIEDGDHRLFWWLGINSVLMILLQPILMRMSRSMWLSWFVKYDPIGKRTKSKKRSPNE